MKYLLSILNIIGYFLTAKGVKINNGNLNADSVWNVCATGGQYHADPFDCHYFIQCSNGIPYRQKCATPLYWNQKRLTCQWSNGHCRDQISTTTDATISTEATIISQPSSTIKSTTPPAMATTSTNATTTCKATTITEATDIVTTTQPIATTEFFTTSRPETTTEVVTVEQSSFETTTHLEKPTGNETTADCNATEHTKVATETSAYTTPSTTFQTTDSTKDLTTFSTEITSSAATRCEEGDITAATNCEYYRQCIEGKPTLKKCPEGTYWNQVIFSCTLGQNNCSEITTNTEISTSENAKSTTEEEIITNGTTHISPCQMESSSSEAYTSSEITERSETIEVSKATSTTENSTTTARHTTTEINSGTEATVTNETVTATSHESTVNEIYTTIQLNGTTESITTSNGTTEIDLTTSSSISDQSTSPSVSTEGLTRAEVANVTEGRTTTLELSTTTTSPKTTIYTAVGCSSSTAAIASVSYQTTGNVTVSYRTTEVNTSSEESGSSLAGCLIPNETTEKWPTTTTETVVANSTQSPIETTTSNDNSSTNETTATAETTICLTNNTEYYADPEDCQRFIECVDGQAYGLICPQFYYWNKEQESCIFGDCSTKFMETTALPSTTIELKLCLESQLEFYANPDDCSKFIKCVDGQAYELQCPKLNYWNGEEQSCVLGECPQNA